MLTPRGKEYIFLPNPLTKKEKVFDIMYFLFLHYAPK